MESVYSADRSESLCKTDTLVFKGLVSILCGNYSVAIWNKDDYFYSSLYDLQEAC
jgi:hypothetical protein